MNTNLNNFVLVCIDTHPKSNLLLHAGYKKAKEQQCSLMVLYVETPDHHLLERETKERLFTNLSLAEEMNASVHQIDFDNAVDGIIYFIKQQLKIKNTIDTVVVGQDKKKSFWENFYPSKAEQLTRKLTLLTIQTQIIPLTEFQYKINWIEKFKNNYLTVDGISFAIIASIIAFITTEIISDLNENFYIFSYFSFSFFLIACFITALKKGFFPSIFTIILSLLAIYYYYPHFHPAFEGNYSNKVIYFSVFIISSILSVGLAGFTRIKYQHLINKENKTNALYKINKLVGKSENKLSTIELLHIELSKIIEKEIYFFLPNNQNKNFLELYYPKTINLLDKEKQALKYCWTKLKATGVGSIYYQDIQWRFEPLIATKREIGIMGIRISSGSDIDLTLGKLFSALVDQSASILEKIELTNEMNEIKVREEQEKLRSLLLSSVSHDLKTPLASIIGSLSVYQRMKENNRLNPDTADELIKTALEESQRLNSFISNILEMTRLESGEINFSFEWKDPLEVINSVLKRFKTKMKNHQIMIKQLKDDYKVKMDPVMTEEVLQNIIDNAIKYSPINSTINIEYGPKKHGFSYLISDQGQGIPEDKFEAIFDKYERLNKSDYQIAGTGLGLSICKAIMEKQKGAIKACNHQNGGAQFEIWFPLCKVVY